MGKLYSRPVLDLPTEEAARAQFWDDLGDEEYVDNVRTAYADDAEAVAAYEEQRRDGCCGSLDMEYNVNGRLFYMGCNYGH